MIDQARKDILKALATEWPDSSCYAEPFGADSFALYVIWDGFKPGEEEDVRQRRVRDAVGKRLGEEAAAALEYVAFIFAWTFKEKKQYDIDKL